MKGGGGSPFRVLQRGRHAVVLSHPRESFITSPPPTQGPGVGITSPITNRVVLSGISIRSSVAVARGRHFHIRSLVELLRVRPQISVAHCAQRRSVRVVHLPPQVSVHIVCILAFTAPHVTSSPCFWKTICTVALSAASQETARVQGESASQSLRLHAPPLTPSTSCPTTAHGQLSMVTRTPCEEEEEEEGLCAD